MGKNQNKLLSQYKNNNKSVKIFLDNGVRIQGNIIGYDDFSIIIKTKGTKKLIYKHAMTTLEPSS